MTMAAPIQDKARSYQVFPASGPLSDNMNLTTSSLTQRIGMIGGEVYCYILTSVKYFDSRFVQTGSGPNFQGGLLTLCTCKGLMRTGRDLDAWRGIWIAG